jgi:hypothetical protein
MKKIRQATPAFDKLRRQFERAISYQDAESSIDFPDPQELTPEEAGLSIRVETAFDEWRAELGTMEDIQRRVNASDAYHDAIVEAIAEDNLPFFIEALEKQSNISQGSGVSMLSMVAHYAKMATGLNGRSYLAPLIYRYLVENWDYATRYLRDLTDLSLAVNQGDLEAIPNLVDGVSRQAYIKAGGREYSDLSRILDNALLLSDPAVYTLLRQYPIFARIDLAKAIGVHSKVGLAMVQYLHEQGELTPKFRMILLSQCVPSVVTFLGHHPGLDLAEYWYTLYSFISKGEDVDFIIQLLQSPLARDHLNLPSSEIEKAVATKNLYIVPMFGGQSVIEVMIRKFNESLTYKVNVNDCARIIKALINVSKQLVKISDAVLEHIMTQGDYDLYFFLLQARNQGRVTLPDAKLENLSQQLRRRGLNEMASLANDVDTAINRKYMRPKL